MAILKKKKAQSKTKNTQEKVTKTASKEKDVAAKVNTSLSQVLVRPLLSEKTTMLEANGQYSFEVAPSTNKIEVKKAVEATYGVKPVRVNMVNVEGKRKRFGRMVGRRNDWKKAVVTLKKGDKIDIHEGV